MSGFNEINEAIGKEVCSNIYFFKWQNAVWLVNSLETS